MDIVIGTRSGHIWAFNGSDGALLPKYPIKVGGKVNTQIQLISLDNSREQIHLVLHASDGNIYNIDGKTLCFDKIDIGEESRSAIISDDLTQNGKLDLLVLTLRGRAFCVSTKLNYDPSLTWTTNWFGASNVHTSNLDYHGIFVEKFSRKHRDVSGSSFPIVFTITSRRKIDKITTPKYRVEIFLDGKVVMTEVFTRSGVYVWNLPCPSSRKLSTIILKMTNDQGQIFWDYYTLSFNKHFAKTIKVTFFPFNFSKKNLV